MINVMLDLETMGTTPSAAIISIGAVEFDPETKAITDRFHAVVDLASALAVGGTIDASTVMWWMTQSDAARAVVAGGGAHISQVLVDFSRWLSGLGPTEDVLMWGNGAGFDNVLLASAYRAAKLPQPWAHWNDRCYRTIKSLYPGVPLQRVGTHHNALDDAESQARHLMDMLAP